MRELLCVFIGGGVGSTLRFIISLYWRHLSLHPRYADILFPWPTFVANVLGCLLIGILYQYSARWGWSPEVRLLLTTGFCGGFTTFSTFSYENITLLQSGHYAVFLTYFLASLLLGCLAAFLPTLIANHS